ncbi:hypothetical protein E2C01_080922 [Portunus trituberculatus]|nr:hypothetical protein [Portunus trituberculatus]
MHHVTP